VLLLVLRSGLFVYFAVTDYDPEFGMGDHMFNDLALSREMTREFHSKCNPNNRVLKLTVMVLQQSFWPFAPRKSVADLPPSASVSLKLCRSHSADARFERR
jgi:hypothetical protein